MIKRESDEIVYAVHYNHKSERSSFSDRPQFSLLIVFLGI